jgi:uroporphyrinogen-III decarboxylase
MPYQDPDRGKDPGQLLRERAKRLDDVINLRQPDRVPIMMPISYMLAEIGGITKQELIDNPDKCQELLEQAALEYQPDSIFGPMPADSRPYLLLGDRMTAWPGHQLAPDNQYQFVEHEFMKAEDYDDFLEDPSDWAIRKYLPRAYEKLEGFALLPPLAMFVAGSYFLSNVAGFGMGPLAESFRAFAKVIQAVADGTVRVIEGAQRMAALGFPGSVLAGAGIEAPFDLMSDTLRGMRGIMLDLMQRPDKLLAAEEKVAKFQLEFAISMCKVTGMGNAFIPLHRGSDGFMSLKQFEKFYWPQLKYVMETLIENGIRPVVFYEGIWDQRLEYLAELPKGKSIGWFQASDIFKVKDIVGDTMCIIGGMPNSMLAAGTPDEIRARTKKVCEYVGKGGGFMMCTGVGEMGGSRPELVRAWVDATKEFGVY